MSIKKASKRASKTASKRVSKRVSSESLRVDQSHVVPGSTILDPRVQAVIDFMNANLQRRIRSTQLAEVAVLSSSRLSHLFKSETGLAPGEYLIRLRMEKARRLVTTTRLRIKEIMVMSGYDDKGLFARQFGKSFGVAPSKYRKNVSRP